MRIYYNKGKCIYKIMCDEKISIVIPIYNTEQYLDKCVDSVLNKHIKILR